MSKYPALDKALNEVELTKLQAFTADETMLNAVKKVMLFGIYYNGTLKEGEEPDPTRNFLLGLMAQSRNFPNDQLGAVLRAQMEAVSMLEDGFNKVIEMGKPAIVITEEELNQAR